MHIFIFSIIVFGLSLYSLERSEASACRPTGLRGRERSVGSRPSRSRPKAAEHGTRPPSKEVEPSLENWISFLFVGTNIEVLKIQGMGCIFIQNYGYGVTDVVKNSKEIPYFFSEGVLFHTPYINPPPPPMGTGTQPCWMTYYASATHSFKLKSNGRILLQLNSLFPALTTFDSL